MTQNTNIEKKALTRSMERNRILESFSIFSLPVCFQNLIIELLNSNEWDWFKDVDGCTAVADYWPSKYNPACTVHDGLWITGRGGIESDKIFRQLMLFYGMPKGHAQRRYIGVRVAWIFVYKWKHKSKGNKRPLTATMRDCIEWIERSN